MAPGQLRLARAASPGTAWRRHITIGRPGGVICQSVIAFQNPVGKSVLSPGRRPGRGIAGLLRRRCFSDLGIFAAPYNTSTARRQFPQVKRLDDIIVRTDSDAPLNLIPVLSHRDKPPEIQASWSPEDWLVGLASARFTVLTSAF